MANLSEVELQNLRHLLQFGDSDLEKFNNYAENSQDENVKQFFQKISSIMFKKSADDNAIFTVGG